MDNKLPISRLSKFFSQEDFDFQINVGQEYLHGDINMKLVLYRVDRQKTDKDDVYGEVGLDEIKYFPPIEFNALVKIEEPKNSGYKGGMLRYLEPGNLTLSVYLKHLQELGIDISYGDYIGYPVTETEIRYFSVVNDGVKNYDNTHTIMGYKGAFRTIKCASIDASEFRGM